MKSDQILFTEPEAASLLRIGKRTLRAARQDGRLRYVLIGRAIRYTMEDLESFVATLREQKPPCPSDRQPVKARRRRSAEIIPFVGRR